MPTLTSRDERRPGERDGRCAPGRAARPAGRRRRRSARRRPRCAARSGRRTRSARAGMNLLFEGHLERVGDRLEHAKRASAIRPDAPLEARDHAPLDQRHVGERGQQRDDDDDALDERRDDAPRQNQTSALLPMSTRGHGSPLSALPATPRSSISQVRFGLPTSAGLPFAPASPARNGQRMPSWPSPRRETPA